MLQGFKKYGIDRWEFRHDKFQRGRRHLLPDITRRKRKPSVFPSFIKANPAAAEERELLHENRILLKEKAELQSQIAHFKAVEMELRKCLSQSLHKQQETFSFLLIVI